MKTYRPEPATDPDPDQPMSGVITMPTDEVAGLIALLEELDEFLRHGHGMEVLAAFYRNQRAHPGPGFTASCLVDQVGFTVVCLRAQLRTANDDQEALQ